eukprot:TRINITY_DN9831_c0_g1_i1.p1 TRINITY_DN9831_c0_g1~~TRINITY_DN9831_c0_g1_i1.p1  ORF type:complete len:295 (+),score=76.17 TRINITY_DN9831_c0_g1_i1:19-903(+)
MILGISLGIGLPLAAIVGGTVGGIAIYRGKKALKHAKAKAFGKSLIKLEAPHLDPINDTPIVLSKLIAHVIPNGLDQDRIFGRMGNVDNVQRLRNLFNTLPGHKVDLVSEPFDDACSLIKIWLYQLPTALIPSDIADSLFDLIGEEVDEMMLNGMKEVLMRLNERHYEALRMVMQALYTTWNYSAANGMNSEDLASAFGPFLFQIHDLTRSDDTDDSETPRDAPKLSKQDRIKQKEKKRLEQVEQIRQILRISEASYARKTEIRALIKIMIEFKPDLFVDSAFRKPKREGYIRM